MTRKAKVVAAIHSQRILRKKSISRKVSGEFPPVAAVGRDIGETPLKIVLEVMSSYSKMARSRSNRLVAAWRDGGVACLPIPGMIGGSPHECSIRATLRKQSGNGLGNDDEVPA